MTNFYALKFNGTTSSYVSVPPLTYFSSFTVEAWVRIDALVNSYTCIFGDRTNASNWSLMLYLNSNSTNVMPHLKIGGTNHIFTSSKVLTLGQFYHIAMTYNGQSFRLFIDGIEDSNSPKSVSGGIALSTNSWKIGSDTYEESINGVIDELRVWNYARSPIEIYNNRYVIITSSQGLIARYGMDEGAGNVTQDSVTGYQASIINASWVQGVKLIKKKILISSSNQIYSAYSSNPNLNIIPKMTSNNTPKGIVSASSFRVGWEPWKAFDLIINDGYGWTTDNGVVTGWLAYEFTDPICIRKYSVMAHNSLPNLTPKSWTFEGTNDGLKWIILDSQSNHVFVASEIKSFVFKNNKKFKKYRINISSNNGGAYLNINELSMFEVYSELVIHDSDLSNVSEDDFISYGINNPLSHDFLEPLEVKKYIVSTSNLLGNGRVFKSSIDSNKTPIKKVLIK